MSYGTIEHRHGIDRDWAVTNCRASWGVDEDGIKFTSDPVRIQFLSSMLCRGIDIHGGSLFRRFDGDLTSDLFEAVLSWGTALTSGEREEREVARKLYGKTEDCVSCGIPVNPRDSVIVGTGGYACSEGCAR